MASRSIPPAHTYQMFGTSDASLTPARADYEQFLDLPLAPCQSMVTGTSSADRRSNCPSSTQGISAPTSVPNIRKRHRNRRRNNTSSQTSVADTANIPENGNQRESAQKTIDNDRPAKRARKVASTSTPDDGAAVRNQSAAGRFSHRQPSVQVPAGVQYPHK
ncbi:hypothetical protein MSAN_01829000 [Mycena sanguinolenta]|uniref:Uncharacterized protein n=1 Tax=Mycena sanguinolenta TaxID=230812 RepID=A0A8H7CQ44_9AGAR|nr:hypothetical protein MSAN_01829000 [Mycena sanguinolenta]